MNDLKNFWSKKLYTLVASRKFGSEFAKTN